MKISTWWVMAAPLGLAACDSDTTPPQTTMDPRWGVETDHGPRTQGRSLGRMTVSGQAGEGFDSDGDGRVDEIDLDGDGVSDGEDINGDGEITIWRDLVGGDDVEDPAELNRLVTATPAAAENILAAADPLPGESPSGPTVGASGGVNLVGGMIPTGTPMAGVLRARQQADMGSCAAFATSAAVALLRYRREQATNPGVDITTLWPSPLYVYQYNSTFEGGSCGATSVAHNLDRFVLFGAPAESELRYGYPPTWTLSTNRVNCQGPMGPATDAAATSPSREAFRIGGYISIPTLGFRDRVRRELDMGRPVVMSSSLPTGFENFRSSTAGVDVTQPLTTRGRCASSTHCGGHAMVIVGYDDMRGRNGAGAYRVLNSWGADWGDNGYLWWDYEAMESLSPTGVSVIPLPAGTPALGTSSAVTVTIPTGARPTLAQYFRWDGRSLGWAVYVRTRWSEPVTVTKISTTLEEGDPEPELDFSTSQSIAEGDLPGIIPTSTGAGYVPTTDVGKMIRLSARVRRRDGTAETVDIGSFVIPAPTM